MSVAAALDPAETDTEKLPEKAGYVESFNEENQYIWFES
jgi:hypothetical protein